MGCMLPYIAAPWILWVSHFPSGKAIDVRPCFAKNAGGETIWSHEANDIWSGYGYIWVCLKIG